MGSFFLPRITRIDTNALYLLLVIIRGKKQRSPDRDRGRFNPISYEKPKLRRENSLFVAKELLTVLINLALQMLQHENNSSMA